MSDVKKLKSVGLTQLYYKLPETHFSLKELNDVKKISSSQATLKDFGFQNCFIHDNKSEFDELFTKVGTKILDDSKTKPEEIDWVLLYTGLEQFIQPDMDRQEVLKLFKYPVSKVRYDLNLPQANALALSQQGCSGLLSAINIASNILQTSSKKKVLCLTGDVLPPNANREIMYNIMSDAAAGVLIESDTSRNRIINFYQLNQAYYWDTPNHIDELIASYFPMAQRAISTALEQANLTTSDIHWFVPHNVSLRSWLMLAKILNIPVEKIWTKNIKRIGHTVSCDHIINLADMEKEGALKKGDFLLLFTFGFGASWTCLILQH